MQIRLVDQDHLQIGPVTVALANQRILSLICSLFAREQETSTSGTRRPPPNISCH
jgi:hypothetical protein